MLILPSNNAIMKSTVYNRLTSKKKEACDFTFSDFDSVSFKVRTPIEDKEVLYIEMNIPFWDQIAAEGAEEGLKKLYGDYLDGEIQDGNIVLKLKIDDFDEEKADEFSSKVSNIKNDVVGEVFRRHFEGIKEGSPSQSKVTITPRKDTAIFVNSGSDRVNITFALHFENKTDRLIGNSFLAEFVETKRKLGAAPICVYSGSNPTNLKDFDISNFKDFSFLTISLLGQHFSSDKKVVESTELLLGFRQFVNYHIKSSKSFFHQRMRLQVANMLKILNRAKNEKKAKAKTFSGKTFRKT